MKININPDKEFVNDMRKALKDNMGLHTPMMQPASETAVWAPRTARRKRNHT